MVLNGILILIDLIWLLSVGSIWTATEKNNPVWGHLHGLHAFVIFISVVNLFLKVILSFNPRLVLQQQYIYIEPKHHKLNNKIVIIYFIISGSTRRSISIPCCVWSTILINKIYFLFNYSICFSYIYQNSCLNILRMSYLWLMA